jgi:haloacetate dehalogenase
MYEGFRRFDIQTSDPQVSIRGVIGGSGPPVLPLHGNPLTHYHWRFVAPRLATDFTVVATDLRGYGDSGKPRGLPDHSNYSFRRMAQDQVDVMRELGFRQFMLAGHDRGARTAYRMALDHPEVVRKLCAIDILPTHHVWTHVTREWALNSYHWAFMAQPYDFPERLLAGKEEYYIRLKLGSQGMGKGGITEDAIKEYILCCTPENIHGVCEDYRAGATIDYEMDKKDLEAGNKIACPVLVIVGGQSHTAKFYG